MASRKFSPTQLVPPADPVSSKDALDFVRELQTLRLQQLKEKDPALRRELGLLIAKKVRDTPLGTLQGIARRIMMDFAKGPPYNETRAAEPRPTPKRPAAPRLRRHAPGGKRGT
jgi:hypothetical protein